jgi:hypothetical protein
MALCVPQTARSRGFEVPVLVQTASSDNETPIHLKKVNLGIIYFYRDKKGEGESLYKRESNPDDGSL